MMVIKSQLKMYNLLIIIQVLDIFDKKCYTFNYIEEFGGFGYDELYFRLC